MASGYSVSFTTGNAACISSLTCSLTLPSNFPTYFWSASFANGGTGSAVGSGNWIVDSNAITTPAPVGARLHYITSIGHDSEAIGTFSTAALGVSTNTALAGMGANVLFANGQAFTANANGASTLGLTYNVPTSNSFAILLYSSSQVTITSFTTNAPSNAVWQDILSTTGESAIVAINSLAAGSYSANMIAPSSGALSVAVYVFPPYTVTLNDNPSAAGNILTQGIQYQSGNAIQTIGTDSAQAVSNTGYAFSSWSVDNAANIVVANTASSPTALAVEGSGTITANYQSSLSGITLTPSNAVLDSGQTEVFTGALAGGVSPYTYNYFNVTGGTTLNKYTGVAGTSNAFAFTVSSSTQNHALTYNLVVTDSFPVTLNSIGNTIIVNTQLAAPAAPTLPANAIDHTQPITITGVIPSTGTPPYDYSWLVSIDGPPYVVATRCGVDIGTGQAANAVESCVVPGNTLSAGNTYALELQVEDGASTPEVVTSPSNTFTVDQTATPGNLVVSGTKLDADEGLLVTGVIPFNGAPPYSYAWLVSENGGAYATTTQCGVNSGTGQAANAVEDCAVSGGTLTAGTAYNFELQVTDSDAMTTNSAPSNTVTIASQLTAPQPPTVSAPLLDNDQVETISGTVSSTGTSPYSYVWQRSVDGGPYAVATMCDQNSGAGQVGGAVVTCTIEPSNALPAGQVPNFELQVRDGSSTPEGVQSAASVNILVALPLTAPAAPTVSAQQINSNQAETINGIIPSTGTSPYSYNWLVSTDSLAYVAATQCSSNSGIGRLPGSIVLCSIPANILVAGFSYLFELMVTDSATFSESMSSSALASIIVASQLTTPLTPTLPSSTLTVNTEITISSTLPSTGTPPYAYTWLVSDNGGVFTTATQCTVDSGTGQAAASKVVCNIPGYTLAVGHTYVFRLQVSDATSETEISDASDTLTVNQAPPASGAITIVNGGGGPIVGANMIPAPIVRNVSNGVIIAGLPTQYSFNVTLFGQKITVKDNFITQNSVGIEILGVPYVLPLNKTVPIISLSPYYVKLSNIVYSPALPTVNITIFTNASPVAHLVVSVENKTAVVNNYTKGTLVRVDLKSPRMTFDIYLSQSTNMSVINVTASGLLPPTPQNYHDLLAYNITMTRVGINGTTNITVNTTLGYNCSIPAQSIRLLILGNGTWSPLAPFTVNASSCTVSFQLHSDPVIALAEYVAPATTTVTTAMTTTIPQAAAASGQGVFYYALAIVAIVLLALLLLFIKRRRTASDGHRKR